MPFRKQVLIPGPELLGVGGTRRRAFTPDMGGANAEDGVDDLGNGIA